MNTITTLKASIAHTIASVNTFFEAIADLPVGKFNSVACDFHDTFTTKYSLTGEISHYFPEGKTLDNISDADYNLTSNLLDSLFATKEAIIANASFLILHNNISDEVKVELEELKVNADRLQQELDVLVEELNNVDFSNFYYEDAVA